MRKVNFQPKFLSFSLFLFLPLSSLPLLLYSLSFLLSSDRVLSLPHHHRPLLLNFLSLSLLSLSLSISLSLALCVSCKETQPRASVVVGSGDVGGGGGGGRGGFPYTLCFGFQQNFVSNKIF